MEVVQVAIEQTRKQTKVDSRRQEKTKGKLGDKEWESWNSLWQTISTRLRRVSIRQSPANTRYYALSLHVQQTEQEYKKEKASVWVIKRLLDDNLAPLAIDQEQ